MKLFFVLILDPYAGPQSLSLFFKCNLFIHHTEQISFPLMYGLLE